MQIKIFQNPGHSSDEKLVQALESDIASWQENAPVKIVDVQLSSAVIARPGQKSVLVQPLCAILYEPTGTASGASGIGVKVFARTVIHNTLSLANAAQIETSVNDWVRDNQGVEIELMRVASDAASWVDQNDYYHYCYSSLGLLVYRRK